MLLPSASVRRLERCGRQAGTEKLQTVVLTYLEGDDGDAAAIATARAPASSTNSTVQRHRPPLKNNHRRRHDVNNDYDTEYNTATTAAEEKPR